MIKDAKDDKGNILFNKLCKLINLLCQLSDCGINEYIKFPRIVSIGTPCSGKSSVLESILGFDFLPRGDGGVTRRPLEIKLCHTNYGEPWAIFEERKGKKFTDFDKVRETIENLTDEVCNYNKKIVDVPIILNIYSQKCPDLVFVDLPGIREISFYHCPWNIELISRDIVRRYIEDPLTIILCVIAANSDIFTSESLRIAKEIDVTGLRTLGVLTKLDIMDAGTDARKVLLNEEIPLKLGYIGVRNRTRQDLFNKLSKSEILRKEKEFFKLNIAYKYLPPEYLGNDALLNKLTKIYLRMIRENLQRILKKINDRIKKVGKELNILENNLSIYESGKMNLLWNLIKEYCDKFRNILKGKYNNREEDFLEGEGGFKLKMLYKKLLEEYIGDYKATEGYTDDYINYALTIHEGDSIPGFINIDAFIYLLNPQLEKLKQPIEECFTNVFKYLGFLSKKILEKTFINFPQAINDLTDLINNYLVEEKNKTKYLIDSIVNMEINYLFTNDNEYLNNYSINNEMRFESQMAGINLFIKEIRNSIDAYFKLIVRNLRESIPKIIGHFLIKEIEYNMQLKLYTKLYKIKNINDLFIDSENVYKRKKELNDIMKELKKIEKIIRSDSYFMNAMEININNKDFSSINT